MIARYVLTRGGAEILHPVRDLPGGVGYAVEQRGSSGAWGDRARMPFRNEELMELRAQLIEASPEPRGSRETRGHASGAPTGGRSRAEADRPHGPLELTSGDQRDQFLAMLGHELRNPLAPVRHAVELLLEHASGQDPAYLCQARTVIARQVEHLGRLVDVLLDVDRRPPGPADDEDPGAAEALVRRVAELHGGHVISEGEPGHGVELRVWLPAAPPEELPAGSGEPVSHAPASRQILVVDDNEDAAEMLAMVLRKRGYTVTLAFDGEEALTLAAAHPPEVVLLDIGLPGIDGYEVARRLRAMLPTEHPMLVAVTGYGQPGDRQRSREAGFDHHMVKPVAIEKLLPLLDATS